MYKVTKIIPWGKGHSPVGTEPTGFHAQFLNHMATAVVLPPQGLDVDVHLFEMQIYCYKVDDITDILNCTDIKH
jgi:hypothetical protein